MALTLGNGPFGTSPAGQFNFTREGPDTVLYWEDFPKRVRTEFNGKTIADSRQVKAVQDGTLVSVISKSSQVQGL